MIIGLSGYAQSGKDEVAKILVEEHGFVRVAFADPIRKLAYELNPIVKPGMRLRDAVDEMGWDKAKVRIPEIRRILQDLGVGGREVIGIGVWINAALNPYFQEPVNIVIPDVRFRNEVSYIRRYAVSEIWRIQRNGVEAVNDHISEHDMDDYKKFDCFIPNNGTLEDLRSTVKEYVELLSVD